MLETIENTTKETTELDSLAKELQVSGSMLRFWQEEFAIGQSPADALSHVQTEELRLVARATKTHQFRLDLVHQDLQKHRKMESEKAKVLAKLHELRQFLGKMQTEL
ncbi:MAG: hypothetical protein RL757_2867 [Bacteroidota bacterium]|jgi:DNA-binding transcriptional MerR regulator